MAAYLIYLVFLLSVIAFSPTRYFNYSLIILISAVPGIVYSLVKYPSKIQSCLIILLMLTIYSGWNSNLQLTEFGHKISSKELISSASIWLVSFVVMKLILHEKILNKINFQKIYFLVFFIIGLYLTAEEFFGFHVTDEGSNSVYYILPVLPCVMYYFPKLRYYVMFLVFFLIVISVKRSAFIIVGLSIIWLLFCTQKGIVKVKGNKNNAKIILPSAIVFFGIILWGSGMFDAMISRFLNISEDGGSGRDVIYEYAWELFVQTDLKEQLLGHGPRFFWSSNSNVSATHNDFLEILISCGIFGVLLFLYMHIQLVKFLFVLVKNKSSVAIPYFICYITFLVWNLIACQFAYQSPTVCTCMFWAIIENYVYHEEKVIICRN